MKTQIETRKVHVASEVDAVIPSFSVVVPCFNEQDAIEPTIKELFLTLSELDEVEIILVNDGSSDGTGDVLERLAQEYPRLRVVHHAQNRGYGAALKTGIRHSTAEMIVITDADGTYPNHRIPDLLRLANDYDMVVGSRTGDGVDYSFIRRIPKVFLASYASWLSGQKIPDINSGLRVMRRTVVEKFLRILPNTFSFTTTITVAMLTNFYRVKYVPISYSRRIGKSKIQPIRDTLRFVQLLVRTGTYFAPLRVFMPVALLFFLGFAVSLANDVFVLRDLTESSMLFLFFGMNTAMFALLADMIDKRTPR